VRQRFLSAPLADSGDPSCLSRRRRPHRQPHVLQVVSKAAPPTPSQSVAARSILSLTSTATSLEATGVTAAKPLAKGSRKRQHAGLAGDGWRVESRGESGLRWPAGEGESGLRRPTGGETDCRARGRDS
jgi:hypothetical protein